MRFLLLAVLLSLPASEAWPRAGGGGGGGGCFPAGTMIATLTGERPIEEIRPGDRVLSFTEIGLAEVEVKEFYKKKNRLYKVYTASGTLTATAEHPLLTRDGFKEVRDLKKGEKVAMLEYGRRVWIKIKNIRARNRAEVYNLEVAPPHTFIADGFIVHNKGGGGGSFGRSGYYRGGRYYSRRASDNNLVFAIAATLLIIRGFLFLSERKSGSGGGSANRLLSNGEIMPRAEATLEILRSLGGRDPAFNPDELESFTKTVFIRVQKAWQARDYSGLRDIMMPNMHAGHSAKAGEMRARGEINMMEDLKILHIDFVHVRCPREKEGRSFTALVTASARDYTVREGSNTLDAGRHEAATFQEFWTFNQLNGNWALARIDQIGDLDFLNAPNLPASPQPASAFPGAVGLAGIAAAIAPSCGPGQTPPPAAAAEGPPKGGFNWDRQKMQIAATLAFGSVYTAWGKNDSSLLKADFISAEALAKLKNVMEARKAEGLTFEFNNLFTRRAEIVLTCQAAKSKINLDEFTARITATAVRSMTRNGKPLHRDTAPEPFTEYWVFGRQNQDWKLRDILPRMEQESADTTQDGAPSPVQIEWYWQA
ncbi:MAG: hypothetical protein AUJ51_12785 [Elusimicrobia bacterium CG1_02_56_21]|nr:MAG: hypothetical protein AUJ51_12785 [Elusimicrobia bacterium CG1_02_56_21]